MGEPPEASLRRLVDPMGIALAAILVSVIGCGDGEAISRQESAGTVALALSGAACEKLLTEAQVIDRIQIHFSPGLDVDPPSEPLETVTFERTELESHCTSEPDTPLFDLSGVPSGNYGAWAEARDETDEVIGGSHSEAEPFELTVHHGETTFVELVLTPNP